MVRTLDKTHTLLSYIEGSLKNVIVDDDGRRSHGFIFSLLNPPVPLGGNIVSLDVYLDEIPISKKNIFISTTEDLVNVSLLSEVRPLAFKPFQTARFLVLLEEGLKPRTNHKIVIMSKLEGFEQILIPFTFIDKVLPSKETISITSKVLDDENSSSLGNVIFKNFGTPLALSGKKAYIICSSNGSVSANWSWMGVRYDNGGLYVPPARAFGRIIVEISMDQGVRKRLPNFVVSSRHEDGVLYTRHELAMLQIKRRLFVPVNNKGFIMIVEIDLSDRAAAFYPSSKFSTRTGASYNNKKRLSKSKQKIRVHFLIDGNITSYGLAAISQTAVSDFNSKENYLHISTAARKDAARYYGTIGIAPQNLPPHKILLDSFDNDLELSYDVELTPGQTTEIALVASGSYTSSGECINEFLSMRDNYKNLFQNTVDHFRKTSESTLNCSSANNQKSNVALKLLRAFQKSKASMEYLKASYTELGIGICAGLPRFPNYWARDTGWSLRGYLSIGDYNFAVGVIDNFLRHQAKKTSRIAMKGELPMIISGKAFLHTTTYGSADSTFLFPWALKQYVLATGDVFYLRKRWESIVDLVNWGFLKDLDGDGLVEHGFTGVAEKLPIQDSTWMDHIDRRKSANDIQALFYETLTIGSELADIIEDTYNKNLWLKASDRLARLIDRTYWDARSGYYFDTLRRDGTKDSSIRPNALVLLLTGATRDKSKADSVLDRVECRDITSSWGVRTLSTSDTKYNPTLYHDGAVWPLVSGWAAISEIKYGRKDQALNYISSMSERILSENGMFAETYRGDRPEPFNSCILQAWSIGMYCHAFQEMMLGMKVNMIEGVIRINPNIPESLMAEMSPVEFDYTLNTRNGRKRFQFRIDSANEQISVLDKGALTRDVKVESDTFSLV